MGGTILLGLYCGYFRGDIGIVENKMEATV